jgi:Ca2+-binding EF-hand superfamily protein
MPGFRKSVLLAVLGFTVASAAIAQDQTYEEALAELRTQFRRADVNGDGKLSQQEASNAGMGRLASNFRRVDTDRDGFVTLPQLEARLADQYDR